MTSSYKTIRTLPHSFNCERLAVEQYFWGLDWDIILKVVGGEHLLILFNRNKGFKAAVCVLSSIKKVSYAEIWVMEMN